MSLFCRASNACQMQLVTFFKSADIVSLAHYEEVKTKDERVRNPNNRRVQRASLQREHWRYTKRKAELPAACCKTESPDYLVKSLKRVSPLKGRASQTIEANYYYYSL